MTSWLKIIGRPWQACTYDKVGRKQFCSSCLSYKLASLVSWLASHSWADVCCMNATERKYMETAHSKVEGERKRWIYVGQVAFSSL